MKNLVIFLLALMASPTFAAEITPYNVTVKIQDSSGKWLPGADRGVFLMANFMQGNQVSIDRRFKAKTNFNGQAIIPVDKSPYSQIPFNQLELFCLTIDYNFYCNGANDRDVLTPLDPYLGAGQSNIKYNCLYSLKNPGKNSSLAGEISVICKGL